jgi:steroid 5-alpha reductase family enzyme
MEEKNSKKGIIGTVVTAVIVVVLVILGITFSEFKLTDVQLLTLKTLLIVCSCAIVYCFAAGEITQNFSQMDKLWSILPVAYVWIIAVNGGMKARLVIYALIVTAWGIRLTVNFARKGAYSIKFWTGVEDYRWSIVHSAKFFRSRIAWTAFDLFFISIYQNLLVLAICFPALASMESNATLGIWDVTAFVLALFFLTLETVADEYQWRFHCRKKELLAKEGVLSKLPSPYDLGFNTTGPWSRMRHPNYLGEQGIWMSLYLTAAGAGIARYGIFHWSMTGPLLLVLLFMGSSMLAEKISSGKYPLYADYIGQVSKYIPFRKYMRCT